jgi:hypothetical protein
MSFLTREQTNTLAKIHDPHTREVMREFLLRMNLREVHKDQRD